MTSGEKFYDEVDNLIDKEQKYSDVCNDCIFTIANNVRRIAEKYILDWNDIETEGEPFSNGEYLVTYKTEEADGEPVYAVTDAYWTGMKWEKDFEEFDEEIIAYAFPLPYIP